jgi:hypothetical protein
MKVAKCEKSGILTFIQNSYSLNTVIVLIVIFTQKATKDGSEIWPMK